MGCTSSSSAVDPPSNRSSAQSSSKGSAHKGQDMSAAPQEAQATLEAASKIQRMIRRTNSKGKAALVTKWKVQLLCAVM
jgi:hypothetical protein